MDMLIQIIQFLRDYGWQVGLIVFLAALVLFLLRIILDEDRSALARARIYKSLLKISGKREHEKRYLANDLRGRINMARRKMHFGTQALPQAVKIEWIEGTRAGTYDLSDNEFVIRLDPAEEQTRNIIRMVEAVVCRTSLVGLRNLIRKPLRLALQLTLIRKILRNVRNQKVLDEFFAGFYPEPGRDSDFDTWNSVVVEIDDQGFYERLLLVELEDFARRILGKEPAIFMISEVEYLVRFVHRIATRDLGVEVPLVFKRAHIRLGIVLVAKAQKIIELGIDPYIEAARIKIQEEKCDALYFIIYEQIYPKSWKSFMQYKARCAQLQRILRSRFRLFEHFSATYLYVDPNGRRRGGQITRYIPLP
jgi:hypothetical protein